MKKKRIIFILLLLFSIQISPSILAQGDRASWDYKGFIDTYHAVGTTSPHNFLSARTRVRAEVGRRVDRSQFFVSLNLMHNKVQPETNGLELREAYYKYMGNHMGLSIGRQIVIWGAADGVRITDLVSPINLMEFLANDYDDIRMPVNALRLFVFNNHIKFEAVIVPTFEGFKLPVQSNNPWNIFASSTENKLIWNDSKSRPKTQLSNVEYGGRLSFTLSGIDFSLAALHTWNKMPLLSYQPLTTGDIEVIPHYYRMGFIGGDMSLPIQSVVLRGEAAFNIDKHFQSSLPLDKIKGHNSLNWLIGLDWYAPREWFVSTQLSCENIFNHNEDISQGPHDFMMTLNLSKTLLNNTLKISNFSYIDLTKKGCFSRLTTEYSLSDQIHLFIGYDWFGGKKNSSFGVYKNNSEVWLKGRYSF